MQKYNCTRKDASESLKLAFMTYLSEDEVEDFILHIQMKEIRRQEMKLNRKFVTTEKENKPLNSINIIN